ncbi:MULTISPECIES: DUF2442 domain-containing protein [unclassified Synechocystis]|uniref:DUF2442 domain-containing protein n=1 Tax=unclassified Synechocystis TaxID=2640012 RepID=UPI0020114E0F|nr:MULTISPECIES: DUF2442 domain-containing protein [unclassified Synechocystis]
MSVTPLHNYRLKILFENSSEKILNLSSLITTRDCYWRLRNNRYFQQVAIDPLGGLYWPEGEDLAPDGLDRYLERANSEEFT